MLAAQPAYGARSRAAIGAARMSGIRHISSPSGPPPVGARAACAFNLATLAKETAMQTERPDANAELAGSFEPLRIVFALSALLLGLIATVRF
jgi:hypothetical protein